MLVQDGIDALIVGATLIACAAVLDAEAIEADTEAVRRVEQMRQYREWHMEEAARAAQGDLYAPAPCLPHSDPRVCVISPDAVACREEVSACRR